MFEMFSIFNVEEDVSLYYIYLQLFNQKWKTKGFLFQHINIFV